MLKDTRHTSLTIPIIILLQPSLSDRQFGHVMNVRATRIRIPGANSNTGPIPDQNLPNVYDKHK